MNLAVHGIDAVFLVIAAIAFLVGTIIALALVDPRVMKIIYACILGGLFFLTLASLVS